MRYSPQQAIEKIFAVHDAIVGDGSREISRGDVELYLVKVWAILDFTERPSPRDVPQHVTAGGR